MSIDMTERIQHLKMHGPRMTAREYANIFGIQYETARQYGSKFGITFKKDKKRFRDSPDDAEYKHIELAAFRKRISTYTVPQIRSVMHSVTRDIVKDPRVREALLKRVQEILDNTHERLIKNMAENLIDDIEDISEEDIRDKHKDYMPSRRGRRRHCEHYDEYALKNPEQTYTAPLHIEEEVKEVKPKEKAPIVYVEYEDVASDIGLSDSVLAHAECASLRVDKNASQLIKRAKYMAVLAAMRITEGNREKASKILGCTTKSLGIWLKELRYDE